jgi:hypothetical protein
MNDPDSKRPRLVCRLVRFQCFVFGRADQAPGSRHVGTCEACQKFFAAGREMETCLRREAASARTDPPDGLDQAIIRAVRFSRPNSQRPSRIRVSIVSFAALAAGVALAVFVLHRPSPQNELPINPADTGGIADQEDSTPGRLWVEFEPKAAEVVDQSSLQHEFDSVCSDAQSALAFLQINFLPSTPADSLPKHADAGLMRSS